MIELIPQEPVPETELRTVEHKDALQIHADVVQMGEMLFRMGQMMTVMERRLEELEDKQTKLTIRHQDVKGLNDLIGIRAREICGKYTLTGPGDERAIRSAIKKDVKKRYGVQDLHDVPAIALPAVQKQIDRWTDIRLIMKRRELQQELGP